ncbi:MAG: pyrimidine-nucleoside phosphorylase [Clostridiales bacterium]|nr:pyrimidine-nucleoside phosphorylase [Clostridiales bacterium]
MRMYDIIKKKRDGGELSTAEIQYFIKGVSDGGIPDYQISALCMAIYFNGMNVRETCDLTFAVRDSGDKLDFSTINGIRVDKHSTGGVGDKTSLVVAPIVSSFGIKVAKMSGRGLGHTGGTIDKLEAIDGFQTTLSEADFIKQVNDIGFAIVGQSKQFAPADKKLYALRDVTATVDSMPLIAASIMGKKLAADDDCIVLDVKTGSGSFMKSVEKSTELAQLMVDIGKSAGKKMVALITNMDRPLGYAIGNSLEVIEAVETLQGHGPEDFTEVCLTLAGHMLSLAGKGSVESCIEMAKQAIADGSAYCKLLEVVSRQGGNTKLIENTSNFAKAKYSCAVKCKKSGFISKVNTESYGFASLALGAGRNTAEDAIDYSAGIILNKKTGDFVEEGEIIAILYSNDESAFAKAEEILLSATEVSGSKPENEPLIYNIIT